MEKIEKLTHAVVGPHSLERYGPQQVGFPENVTWPIDPE